MKVIQLPRCPMPDAIPVRSLTRRRAGKR